MLCAVASLVGAASGWSEPLAAQFVDRAVVAGLTQRNVSGADQSYIVEGMMGGAAFFDYDRDGDVDLYVANGSSFAGFATGAHPANQLYRNDGGRFADVTVAASAGDTSWSMGCAAADYDNDGWPDLLVADDSTPNLLFRNRRDGRFAEDALMAGVAYSGEGVTQGCMGAAWGDYDNDGRFDLFVTNFADEYNALYRNEGSGFFADVSFIAGIGAAPAELVSWGTGFFDYDNDGDRDLFVANGHTYPQADLPRVNSSYEQANSLFENREGRLVEVSAAAGPGFALRRVSRGTSFADYDGDGDIDLFILNLNGPPTLLRNDGDHGNHYLLVRAVGTASNRDGIGARVIISAGGQTQHAEVQSGGSYLSHNDLRLHFGLGEAERVDRLEVRWPSGVVQVLSDIAADQVLTVVEPRQ